MSCMQAKIYDISYPFLVTDAIFDTPLTLTKDIIRTIAVMLLHSENIGRPITVGIVLVLCIQAKIYIISYALPVTGRHL